MASGLQKNVASLLAQFWVAPFCGTGDPYGSFEGRQLLYDWLLSLVVKVPSRNVSCQVSPADVAACA